MTPLWFSSPRRFQEDPPDITVSVDVVIAYCGRVDLE